MRNQVILWLINTWGEGRSMRSYYFRLLHFSVSCVAVFFSPVKKPGLLLLSEVSYGLGTPRPLLPKRPVLFALRYVDRPVHGLQGVRGVNR